MICVLKQICMLLLLPVNLASDVHAQILLHFGIQALQHLLNFFAL